MSKKTAKIIVFLITLSVSFVLGGAYAFMQKNDLSISILFFLVGSLLLFFLIKTLWDLFET